MDGGGEERAAEWRKDSGENGGTETDWRVTRRVSIHYVYSLRYRATDGSIKSK